MKIVLIEPRQGKKNVYSKIPMPLLGLIYIGTILKEKGHQVEIYNEDMHIPDYSKIKADLIGISILTVTANRGYEISKMFPKEKVIIGGIHASLLPDEAIQYARQVVVGEAENVIVDIVEGRLTDPIVKGTPVENLDILPFPDFSLIHGYNMDSMVTPISTSRGCPYDCSFCTVTKLFGRRYRFRGADNVINEIQRKKARRFFFCDDNFTANPKRTDILLNMLKKNKVKKWACQVRCDIAKNNKLVTKMKQAGCDIVCVGFESINPKTLNDYNKMQSVDEIVSSIKTFHKNNIKIHGMFVFGGDHDNKKTIWDTLRFAITQKIDTIQMMILTPFPGTQVHEKLKNEKRIFSKNWSLYDGQNIVFNPLLLSANELQMNVVNAYSKFYSLSRIINLITKFKFKNAILNIMGWTIFREWKKLNIKHQKIV